MRKKKITLCTMPEQKETKQAAEAKAETKLEEKTTEAKVQETVKDGETGKKKKGDEVEQKEEVKATEGDVEEKANEEAAVEEEEDVISVDIARQERLMQIRIRDARKSRRLDLSGSTGKSYFQIELDHVPNDVYQTFSESTTMPVS